MKSKKLWIGAAVILLPFKHTLMNTRKLAFGTLIILIPMMMLAASIRWYNDAGIAQKTTMTGNEILSLQDTGPNTYRWATLSDVKSFVGGTTTTNYVLYSSNYYIANTYVSNFFTTNLFVDAGVSNYFDTNIYVTNLYQTNITLNEYISQDTYVSNYVTTNIYNDTYVSNYFATNIFPTTYVYYTNEPIAQVWTNDGKFTFLSGFLPAPHEDLTPITGPPFAFRKDGSLFVGSNVWNDVATDSGIYPVYVPYVYMEVDSNQPPEVGQLFGVSDSTEFNYYSIYSVNVKAHPSEGKVIASLLASTTNGAAHRIRLYSDPDGSYGGTQISITTNDINNIFLVDSNGNVGASGVFRGNGSGLTNLAVIETNLYQTFNVKNLTVESNITYTAATPHTNVWSSGPTGTVDLALSDQNYSASADMDITGVINKSNTVVQNVLLTITASGANRTVYLTGAFAEGAGATSYVCTNGVPREIWIRYTPAFGGRTNVCSMSFWRP